MVASAGRTLRIKYDADGTGGDAAVVIAGARADSISLANTPIDITTKDSLGIITLLDDIGTKQFSLSVSGVAEDSTLGDLANDAAGGSSLHQFEIAVAALGTYSGLFFITEHAYEGSEGDEALTFTCSLTSSGTITVT